MEFVFFFSANQRRPCNSCLLPLKSNNNNNNNNNNRANNWYEQKLEGVVESENFKILWDFTIQCDRRVEARPDIVFVDKKEREVVIIDVANPR